MAQVVTLATLQRMAAEVISGADWRAGYSGVNTSRWAGGDRKRIYLKGGTGYSTNRDRGYIELHTDGEIEGSTAAAKDIATNIRKKLRAKKSRRKKTSSKQQTLFASKPPAKRAKKAARKAKPKPKPKAKAAAKPKPKAKPKAAKVKPAGLGRVAKAKPKPPKKKGYQVETCTITKRTYKTVGEARAASNGRSRIRDHGSGKYVVKQTGQPLKRAKK